MEQIIHIFNEMSPYLLLGFFLAGMMHAFIPSKLYNHYLAKNNFRSVVNAALFGIPLPLCSCGVIPTAMSLHCEGASKGAAISFLIATPQTGIDSIIATFSLMGLPFAIIRPIAALVTALFGGQMVNLFDKSENKPMNDISENKECCCHSHEHEEHGCCCHAEKHDDHDCCHEEEEHCCCHEHNHQEESCGCGCGNHHEAPTSFLGKMKEALEYAFIHMMADIGKWLIIGLVIAGLITAFVPDSFFQIFADNSLLSMLLVLCMAIPMYLCATGSIPIAVALMLKGLTPGAGLVLLMAGPAANAASFLVIGKVLGRRTQIIYLFSIVAGAILFGLAIDHLMPREWFMSNLISQGDGCHEEAGLFSKICSIFLIVMLIYSSIIKRHKHH